MENIRLKMLADFLCTFPEHRFNLRHWAVGSVSNPTTVCAFGAAVLCWPGILKFIESGYPGYPAILYKQKSDFVNKKKKATFNRMACDSFFNLTPEESSYLFYYNSYRENERTPKHVAKRIMENLFE